MKKPLMILLLFPCFLQAQNIKAFIDSNGYIPTHVHYFKSIQLPQCAMGDGAVCTMVHFKLSDCICGAKPTVANVFPRFEITGSITTSGTIFFNKLGAGTNSKTPSCFSWTIGEGCSDSTHYKKGEHFYSPVGQMVQAY